MHSVIFDLCERNLLVISNVRQASLHFKALCDTNIFERQLWGLDKSPSIEEIRPNVAEAIDVFLRAYPAVNVAMR